MIVGFFESNSARYKVNLYNAPRHNGEISGTGTYVGWILYVSLVCSGLMTVGFFESNSAG
jgi:hypothetical protein